MMGFVIFQVADSVVVFRREICQRFGSEYHNIKVYRWGEMLLVTWIPGVRL